MQCDTCMQHAGGGGSKKTPGTGAQLFFRGIPLERGGGGTKKNLHEIVFRTPKAEFSSTPPLWVWKVQGGYFSR